MKFQMFARDAVHTHELTEFRACTFGDGGHYYHEGFDRAVCRCGWVSAPSRNHEALVALWKIHRDDEHERPTR